MKVPDKHFILEKANKYLQGDIGPGMYVESVDIGGWSYVEYESDDVPTALTTLKTYPHQTLNPLGLQTVGAVTTKLHGLKQNLQSTLILLNRASNIAYAC